MLLVWSETWVLTPRIERALDSFMHGAAIQITGRQTQRGWDRKWFYPSLEGAMKETGFKEIRTLIPNRHCNATASGPLRGDQPDRGGKGVYDVVGSKGDQMGDRESKGDEDGIKIGDRHK